MDSPISKYEGIIPPELVDCIKRRSCILFVGSGLSAQVKRSNGKKLPIWGQLLGELLEWAIDQQIPLWGSAEDIKEMIGKGNFLMAAQELQERISCAELSDFYSTVFRESSVCPSKAHRILPTIPFRAVITTNYDTLIEGAYTIENNGKIPPVFTQFDLADRYSILRKEEFFVFKMHGHIDRLSTIVLSSRDYQELIFNMPSYRQFLETIFSIYTVFFIGFGGNDPDLDNVIDKLSSLYSRTLDKHYILLPSGKTNSTEKRRLVTDKRLQVIEYEIDDNHSRVAAFLEELSYQVNRDKNKETDNKLPKDELGIFISGASKDNAHLVKISAALQERGYRVWNLLEEPDMGMTVSEKISRAIQKSYCMLIVCAKDTGKSMWVKQEVNYALSRQLDEKMVIVPIVFGDYGYLPPYLSHIQALKLDENFLPEDLNPLLKLLSKVKPR